MNGAKKTQIVYEVNLNFNIAAKYIEMLKDVDNKYDYIMNDKTLNKFEKLYIVRLSNAKYNEKQ